MARDDDFADGDTARVKPADQETRAARVYRSVQPELENDRYQYTDRSTGSIPGGSEQPLPGGDHGFVIESKDRVQRLRHSHIVHRAIWSDDHLDLRKALDLCLHGLTRVLRLTRAQGLGMADAAAWIVRAGAEAAGGDWRAGLARRRCGQARRGLFGADGVEDSQPLPGADRNQAAVGAEIRRPGFGAEPDGSNESA